VSKMLPRGENVPNILFRRENVPKMIPRGENVPNMLSRGENVPKDVIQGRNLTKNISRGENVPKTGGKDANKGLRGRICQGRKEGESSICVERENTQKTKKREKMPN
jgi:hypothetical protein